MELLEDIKFYNKTGKMPIDCVKEAILLHDLFETVLEETDINTPQREEVLYKINHDDYIRNDYKTFVNELKNNKRYQFLTPYTVLDFTKHNVQTFKVDGYEIGFALKPMSDGGYDIISVHNNTDIRGIGDALIDSAIRLGGTCLDHFDGYLSDFYEKKGFIESERYKWNPAYAPQDWDYEKYGTPDVVMRHLPKQ